MTQEISGTSELTAQWFTEVLRSSGVTGRGAVASVRLERIGTGQMARMVRASLVYEDADRSAPASVVVKFPSDDPGSRELAHAMGMYELEVSFYQDLAQLMGDLAVPRCYLAQIDPQTGWFTLVLEDLSGFTRPGDVFTACSVHDCAAALTELARFQVPMWNSPVLSELAWLSDDRRALMLFDSFAAGLEPFLARFGSALDPEHVELYKAALPRAGEWARSWRPPAVVQHGDFRPDNLMFGVGSGTPPVVLIDFQSLRVGPPGLDVAYFLGSALPPADRRRHERDLVAEYHRGLLAGGVTDFDLDACWNAYREGALYGVLLFAGVGARFEPSERGDRMIANQARLFADMALDLDALNSAGLSARS